MEQFGTELARYMLKTRESLEDLLIKFYIKYIPEGDDDNLTIHTWRPLKPVELRELRLRTGARALELLSKEGEIRRIDMLRTQIMDIVEAYADVFRIKASVIPAAMRSRLDTELNSFASGVLAEIYEKLRICFVCGYTAKRTMETISSIFDKRATRLSGVIQWHYGHIEKYLQLKGYELAGHERFKFIVNETENTCELCLSQKDKVYTADELAENGMFPPLHPNCGCYLATMDGERVGTEASISRAGGGGETRGGGAGRYTDDTRSVGLSGGATESVNWYDPLLRIHQDTKKLWNMFITSQEEREENRLESMPAYLDWMTYGLLSANKQRSEVMLNDPNLYNIGNWLTSGIFDVINGTVNPDEPLSLEHWLNSLGTASLIYAGYYAATKSMALNEPPRLPDKIPQAQKQMENKLRNTPEGKGSNKIPWDSWQNYEKVTVNGHEYAKVGDRLYSKHAVDRMQPSGNRFTVGGAIKQVGGVEGRSVAPQFVEDVISSVEPVFQPGTGNYAYTSGTVTVITNPEGAVVTIITR